MLPHLLLDTIDAIYDTVGAPERWPSALDAIGRMFDAKGTVLIMQNVDGRLTSMVSPALAEAQRDYDREWWRHDLPSLRAIEQGCIIPGNVLTDRDLVTPEERATHPFYSVFRARHDLGGFLAGSISPSPSTITYVSVQQAAGGPEFDDAHRSLLERLLRHCERALLLSCRTWEQSLVNMVLEDMLSRLDCGVMMLDHDGRLVRANAAGERLLRSGIRLADRRLALHNTVASHALDLAVLSALRDTPEDRIACARPVIAPRPDGQRPLIVYVLPLRSDAAAHVWSPMQRIAVLVIAIDPAICTDLDPALVRDYLGLTLGEARIAAQIGLGRSPREAAEKLRITEETARTTLKRVFSKAGVSRQSELASLLARLELITLGRAGEV